jgi:hypothetical protein
MQLSSCVLTVFHVKEVQVRFNTDGSFIGSHLLSYLYSDTCYRSKKILSNQLKSEAFSISVQTITVLVSARYLVIVIVR